MPGHRPARAEPPRHGDTVDILPVSLERFYPLQIPVGGEACIEVGGEPFASDPGCARLISPDLRMHW